MKKKICVYAICKNEIKFVDRWLTSLFSESDYIVVLDTGSTDGTFEFLQQDSRVYRVEQKNITPWRFDTARNESMKLIPEDADICVVSDFDQIFRPGWGEELRRLFEEGYEEIYGDIIDYNDDNIEIKKFLSKNVHPNDVRWYWERPIHEGLIFHGENEPHSITSDIFVIEHHPDYSKSRGNYLNLLEEEYKGNSSDPMCAIYYGCELCFHGREDEGLQVFLKANEECDYSSHPEVGYQIQLNIADAYKNREEFELALSYAKAAEKYGIITRRLYMARADIYFAMGDYVRSIKCINKALAVKYNYRGWVETNDYFEGKCYDQLAFVYWLLHDYVSAIAYCSLALYYKPDDTRLLDNKQCFISAQLKALEEKETVDSLREKAEHFYNLGDYCQAMQYGGLFYKLTNNKEIHNKALAAFWGSEENYGGYLLEEELIEYIKNNFNENALILDVGAEYGRLQDLLKYNNVEAIEINTAQLENLNDKYKVVYPIDIRDFKSDKQYDLIVIADVLEHFSLEDAQNLLKYFKTIGKNIICIIPYMYVQDGCDNPYDVHIQYDLTAENVKQRYPELKLIKGNQLKGMYVLNINN